MKKRDIVWLGCTHSITLKRACGNQTSFKWLKEKKRVKGPWGRGIVEPPGNEEKCSSHFTAQDLEGKKEQSCPTTQSFQEDGRQASQGLVIGGKSLGRKDAGLRLFRRDGKKEGKGSLW